MRYALGAEWDELCSDGHLRYVVRGHISYKLADVGRINAPALEAL